MGHNLIRLVNVGCNTVLKHLLDKNRVRLVTHLINKNYHSKKINNTYLNQRNHHKGILKVELNSSISTRQQNKESMNAACLAAQQTKDKSALVRALNFMGMPPNLKYVFRTDEAETSIRWLQIIDSLKQLNTCYEGNIGTTKILSLIAKNNSRQTQRHARQSKWRREEIPWLNERANEWARVSEWVSELTGEYANG